MVRPDFDGANWRTSRNNCGDGGCVAVALADGMIGIRDTKNNGDNHVLVFTPQEWTSFLAGAQNGEFTLESLGQ